jgi:drug/metabolite transporter (DMT)-like permease
LKQGEGKITIGFEAATTLILMAGVPVFIKFTSANPLTIGLFRLSVATILMAVFFTPFKKDRPLNKSMLLPLIIIGFLFATHWITYFLSIKKATASIGILGISTYGIHLIFLGWAFRKDKPGIFDFLAISLAVLGTYIIIPELSFSNNTTIGILLGTLSGFCFALLPILHQKYHFIPDRIRIFGQFFFAWLVFMFFIPWTNWQLESSDWWSLLYLAIPGTFIAHSLWVRVTTRISTTISSLIFYLIIPMTMLISYFWLKESMPFPKIAGALLIVFGNVLSISKRLKR